MKKKNYSKFFIVVLVFLFILMPIITNAIIRKGSNSITDNTPERCIKKSYNIGYTEFTNICSDNPEFSKEKVGWGTINWGLLLLVIVAVFFGGFKVLTKNK